jgi:hypothetical protein
MNILHIVPDSVGDSRYRFLGSTKDIHGRLEYFRSRDVDVSQVEVPRRSDIALLAKLKSIDVNRFDVVLMEVPVYPRSMAYLRRRTPRLKVVSRSINAELPHRLDALRLATSAGMRVARVRELVKRSLLDFVCARLACVVLAITEWEARHYWARLAGRSRVVTVPYFVPAAYLGDSNARTEAKKERLCVCLTSVAEQSTPFVLDAARNFVSVVASLGDRCQDWRFALTGNVGELSLRLATRVEALGVVDDPNSTLARSRALAVLTNYGYGFKTKLLDAAVQRTFALVGPHQYQRLPFAIRPSCVVVAEMSAAAFEDALARTLAGPPPGDINAHFREQAFAALDLVWGCIAPNR